MVILSKLKTKLKGYKNSNEKIQQTCKQFNYLAKSEAVYEYVVLLATGAVNRICFDYR